MASIHKTDDGTYRVRWRDPSGKQQSRNFRTRREASNFVAEIRVAVNRGAYIDPRAGKQKFGPYALRWLESRNDEKTTAARDASVMTNHVLARWSEVSIMAIDHTSVQAWVTELSERKGLSPATVTECFRLTNNVLRPRGGTV